MAEVADSLTRRADYALYVVTASDRSGQRDGCLAGFVTQCSIEPVRFLVCVSAANRTYEVVRDAPGIALHLLGRDQHHMASLFGESTGDDVDKFADVDWAPGSTGAPILVECSAWIEGPIDERHDVGDHQALLVTPSAGGAGPCPGCLTYQHARDLRAGHQPDDR